MIAKGFVSTDDCNKQWYQEINHTQPCKQNIKESQGEVNN
jgi:hypothetical protein